MSYEETNSNEQNTIPISPRLTSSWPHFPRLANRSSDTNLLDNFPLDESGGFCSRSLAHILRRYNVSVIMVNDWCAARRRQSVWWKCSASKSISRTLCNQQPPSTQRPPSTRQPQVRSLIAVVFEDAVSPLSPSRAKCTDNRSALSEGRL
jgi:hypothetical protein